MKYRSLVMAVLFMGLAVFAGSMGVAAASPWDETGVAPDYDWTVEFNTELDEQSVNGNTIYVEDKDGNPIATTVELKENGEAVLVEAPEEGYRSGATYNLHVAEGISSATGRLLEKEVTMQFEIEKLPEYSEKEMAYFEEIAFGSEWGSSDIPLRKWESDPRIKVHGNPTEEDMNSLNSVIDDVNSLQESIDLKLVENNANIDVYYVPLDEFDQYVTNPKGGNWGLFYYWTGDRYVIDRSKILIATDFPDQGERSHLVREELTQTLGLTRDSETYPESMFYQHWTTTQEFLDIDEKLIQMLYDDRIDPGMNREEARSALDG
ncbi:DUF2927 domain-containing protein [Salimicrobium flavidum]|uniref:SbsA Ig-like domain-containing protein n=1 Tax=Salimicrobium flavidum TaxID=570947 RepID=A0A1N7IZ15_9BACI|nr:DUF2927 domain-containing protein [Salimicrobium flavidum]SIS42338.1 Protein of unknown function [Salimicrobium flavidum]